MNKNDSLEKGNTFGIDDIRLVKRSEVKPIHIKQALDLDYIVYPNDFHLSPETCYSYHRKNNQIYTMLLKDGRVIGYANFSPVTPSAYEKMRSGNNTDVFLTEDDITDYIPNSRNLLYFSSIVIHPNYQKKGLAYRILDSVMSDFVELADRNIIIDRILADAISAGGRAICDKLGMSQLKASKHNSSLFESVCTEQSFAKTNLNEKLFERYKKIFEENI